MYCIIFFIFILYIILILINILILFIIIIYYIYLLHYITYYCENVRTFRHLARILRDASTDRATCWSRPVTCGHLLSAVQVTGRVGAQLPYRHKHVQTQTAQVVKTQTIRQEIGMPLQEESRRDTNSRSCPHSERAPTHLI